MKPIISGSGSGKTTFVKRFIGRNVFDRIYACGYFGTTSNLNVALANMHVTNNPILLHRDDSVEELLKVSTSPFDDDSFFRNYVKSKEEWCEKWKTQTEEGFIWFLETLGLYQYCIDPETFIAAIRKGDYYCAFGDDFIAGSLMDVAPYIGASPNEVRAPLLITSDENDASMLCVVSMDDQKLWVSSPVWLSASTVAKPFRPVDTCFISLEGFRKPIMQVKTPRVLDSRSNSGSEELPKDFLQWLSFVNLEEPVLSTQPVSFKSSWDDHSSILEKNNISKKQHGKFCKYYNKLIKTVSGVNFSLDPYKVNISKDTIIGKTYDGDPVVYPFNGFDRILDCDGEIYIDSLTSLLWSNGISNAKAKGAISSDLLSSMQATTYSEVRPLYVPNSNFDPFGGEDFAEMTGGAFVRDLKDNKFLGFNSWFASRYSNRACLELCTNYIRNFLAERTADRSTFYEASIDFFYHVTPKIRNIPLFYDHEGIGSNEIKNLLGRRILTGYFIKRGSTETIQRHRFILSDLDISYEDIVTINSQSDSVCDCGSDTGMPAALKKFEKLSDQALKQLSSIGAELTETSWVDYRSRLYE